MSITTKDKEQFVDSVKYFEELMCEMYPSSEPWSWWLADGETRFTGQMFISANWNEVDLYFTNFLRSKGVITVQGNYVICTTCGKGMIITDENHPMNHIDCDESMCYTCYKEKRKDFQDLINTYEYAWETHTTVFPVWDIVTHDLIVAGFERELSVCVPKPLKSGGLTDQLLDVMRPLAWDYTVMLQYSGMFQDLYTYTIWTRE